MQPQTRFDQLANFVRVWQRSDCFADVCFNLGMDARTASNLAAHMRRNLKVPLKKFKARGVSHSGVKQLLASEIEQLRRIAEIELGAVEVGKYRKAM